MLSLLLTFVLAAPAQTPAAEAAPSPPKLRLPGDARPIRQTVELTLVPSRESFSGTTEIELELKQATRLLWLNASQLTIRAARILVGSADSTARAVAGGDDFVGLAFEN